MRTPDPKPPRFNRYNVYLIVALIVLAPVFASRGISRACRIERLASDPTIRCVGLGEWRWFLETGGNWEAWLWCAVIATVIVALIYLSFH
jgi:hypothetical protein